MGESNKTKYGVGYKRHCKKAIKARHKMKLEIINCKNQLWTGTKNTEHTLGHNIEVCRSTSKRIRMVLIIVGGGQLLILRGREPQEQRLEPPLVFRCRMKHNVRCADFDKCGGWHIYLPSVEQYKVWINIFSFTWTKRSKVKVHLQAFFFYCVFKN